MTGGWWNSRLYNIVRKQHFRSSSYLRCSLFWCIWRLSLRLSSILRLSSFFYCATNEFNGLEDNMGTLIPGQSCKVMVVQTHYVKCLEINVRILQIIDNWLCGNVPICLIRGSHVKVIHVVTLVKNRNFPPERMFSLSPLTWEMWIV